MGQQIQKLAQTTPHSYPHTWGVTYNNAWEDFEPGRVSAELLASCPHGTTPLTAAHGSGPQISIIEIALRNAPRVWIGVRGGLGHFFAIFLDFFLYGSWEALDSSQILPRGTPTFSTPGEAIPRIFDENNIRNTTTEVVFLLLFLPFLYI